MTEDPRSMFDDTPPAPDTRGWAGRARRRAARTGTAVRMGLVTVAVVAGLAVPLITTSVWGRGPNVAATVTSEPIRQSATAKGDRPESRSPDPTPAGECEALQPQSGTTGEVPAGANTLTMCGAAANGVAFRAPVRPLTSNIDDIASFINTRPPFDGRNSTCTMELSAAYNLVFGYPDGRRTVVNVQLYGCRLVVVDDQHHRTGADELTALLRTRWTEQNRAETGTAARPGSWCPDATYSSTSFLKPELSDMRSGRLCRQIGQTLTYRESQLSASDLGVLQAALRSDVVESRSSAIEDPGAMLVLADGNGDLLFVGQSLSSNAYIVTGGTFSGTWTPGPAARAVLERLLR